jgi:CBS domain-containing protein
MSTIKQLLNRKGYQYLSIPHDATVYSALELMAREGVGSLLVTEGEALSGIFTERIYANEVELKGRTAKNTLVKDVMRTSVIRLCPTDSVETCMELMMDNRVRYLPVIDNGRILGVVSISDLIKCANEDQRFTIEQLEHFINGELLHH